MGQERDRLASGIGDKIRALRKRMQLSQEGLARQAEVSRETVRRAEAGENVPDWNTIRQIAAALQVPMQKLLPEAETSITKGRVQ